MGLKGILTMAVSILFALSLAGFAHAAAQGDNAGSRQITMHFFWGEGCPHCARAKPFLEDLQRKYPGLRIESHEVFTSRENMELLVKMARDCGTEAVGVPTIFINGRVFAGFSAETRGLIERELQAAITVPVNGGKTSGKREQCESAAFTLPFMGKIDTSRISLPLFTFLIAGLDSFNPCAFFVLFFLLSLLIHVHSRARMLAVGGTFVFFSGLIYFFFMAAWLNLFLVTGHRDVITAIAALVALLIAVINIKDFFFFKRGVSLVIPEDAKPKLFQRMGEIVRAGSFPMMLAGTVVLAVAANTYELLCTAGFPMVYTRVLTLNALPPMGYYLYLAFYNIIYVIPLAIIVIIFVTTLGSRRLTEWEGRVLKLVAGCMMLGLGIVLLVKPTLLNNALVSAALMAGTLAVSGMTAWMMKRLERKREEK